jgi:hypothetical protein
VDGETFWAAPLNEYQVQLWRTDGRLIRTLAMGREWFPPWSAPERLRRSRDRPPVARLGGGIFLDPDGLLWVVSNHAAAKWSEAYIPGKVDAMGNPDLDIDKYLVPVIEVIDPVKGVVLARHRLDHAIDLAGPNAFRRSWVDADGMPRVQVIPVRLVGRPSS